MSYKTLLINLDSLNSCSSWIAVAVDLAARFDAHLTGLCVVGDPMLPGALLGLLPEDALEEQRDWLDERAKAAEARFRQEVSRAGLAAECRIDHVPEPDIASTIALHARYADMAILGQSDPADPDRRLCRPADVLLASGRPVLIVPYAGTRARVGTRVLVAWDASREATRAVHDALPLLVRAERVHVLCVNPESTNAGHRPGPAGDIAGHLARHGVRAEFLQERVRDAKPAEVILSRIADLGADLVVAGAYGRSRLRELLLGGVTRALLQSMSVPVLMSH